MGQSVWSRASFEESLIPMVIADDERRYVAANSAACLLLRLPEEEVLKLRIDDLAPEDARGLVESLWQDFLEVGVQEGFFELKMPDGATVRVEYSSTANVEPGRHLAIWLFPPSDTGLEPAQARPALLTDREREVLAMVAMGRGTTWIASEMGISTSTVETHVRHCLEKLGARNRAHAIVLGLQEGEIKLEMPVGAHRRYWG